MESSERCRGERAAAGRGWLLTFKPPEDLLPFILQLALQLLPPLSLLGNLIILFLFSRIPGGSPAQNLPRSLPILILYPHGRGAATEQRQEEVRVS